jgi:hypothetical protein
MALTKNTILIANTRSKEIGNFTLSSCSNDRTRELPISDNSNSFQEVAKQFPVNANGDVKVVSIDSCEYIVWGGSHGEIGYAHKGNCKWCRLR